MITVTLGNIVLKFARKARRCEQNSRFTPHYNLWEQSYMNIHKVCVNNRVHLFATYHRALVLIDISTSPAIHGFSVFPLGREVLTMDLDDLFDAFDGADKVKNVEEPKDSAVEHEKRKHAGEGNDDGRAKRQAVSGSRGTSGDGQSGLASTNRTSENRGPVSLVEEEGLSTVREDGTLVKKVRVVFVMLKGHHSES